MRFALAGGVTGRPLVLMLVGELGESGRLAWLAIFEAWDVAACRRVGGAAAICLAFARLAAIAAATLLFFST